MAPRRSAKTSIFVIGAAKAGTTWLHSQCEQHPELATPSIKETNYFAHRFDRGPSYYDGLYPQNPGLRVDNTPAYLADPLAPERIREYNPDARLVVILRNSLDRAISHYDMLYNNGSLTGELDEDLAVNSRVVQDSLYGTHLGQWTQTFGASRIGVFFFTDIRSNPSALWEDFCRFVGVTAVPIRELKKPVNARRGRPRALWLYRTLVNTASRASWVTRVIRYRRLRGIRGIYHRAVFAQDSAALRVLPRSAIVELAGTLDADLERLPIELQIPSSRVDELRSTTSRTIRQIEEG